MAGSSGPSINAFFREKAEIFFEQAENPIN
jgi:hypothetical protein